MFRKWIWVIALVSLIVIAMLAIGGFAALRVGWWQSYRMGRLAGGEEGTTMPMMPFGRGIFHPRPRLWFHPLAFGLGLIVKVGMLLLGLALIGKLFRHCAWKRAHWGHPPPEDWRPDGKGGAAYWHCHPGPVPPRWWGWHEPTEEQVGKVKPDAHPEDTAESGDA